MPHRSDPSPRPSVLRRLAVLTLLAAAVLALQGPGAAQAPSPRLKSVVNPTLTVHGNNRRYFMLANACEAIYLAGTNHRANMQDIGATYPPPAFNFAGAYPPADAPRANFIRGWHHEHSRWDRDVGSDDWVLPLPFARTGGGSANDGRPRFNLAQYDGSYVSRLQSRATTAAGEGMFLSIMLFNGFSVENRGTGEFTYTNHPFHSQNNVNSVNGDWTTVYPQGGELHSLVAGKPAAVTSNQDNYVRHIVTSLNGHERILWEVSNESHSGSLAWQNYIAGVIRNHEAGLTKRHLVWISHPQGVSNVALYNSAADVISPSWREQAVTATGGTGPGTLYQTDPPVTSGAKIVILDTDHLDPDGCWYSRGWVWRAFTRGYHVALLDDFTTCVASRQQVRDAIDDTVDYSRRVRLVEMAPQSESQSTPCSTRYCLYTSNDPDPQPYAPAVPNGKQYLVFKPSTTSQVTIFGLPSGDYLGEWFRVSDGAVSAVPLFTHGTGNLVRSSPFGTSEAVFYLRRGGLTVICA